MKEIEMFEVKKIHHLKNLSYDNFHKHDNNKN